jgi:putative oxidoreductase
MQNLKRLFAVPDGSSRLAIGLFILRVVAGLAMATHGWGKIKNPMHWMDKAPNPPHAIFQLLAAVSEFFGGLAIAAGLLTPLAALGIACTMCVAIYTHVAKGDAFKGYELAVLYLAASLALMIGGPGKLSADALLFGKKRG